MKELNKIIATDDTIHEIVLEEIEKYGFFRICKNYINLNKINHF